MKTGTVILGLLLLVLPYTGVAQQFHVINDQIDGLGYLRLYDFDEDGDLDIIRTGDDQLTLEINDGSGQFTSQVLLSEEVWSFDLGDFDGDQDLDIVYARQGFGRMAWNNGHNVFTGEPLGFYVSQINADDLDNDGDIDLFRYWSDEGYDFYTAFLNNGNGEFEAARGWSEEGSGATCINQIGDIDGDGLIDWYGSVEPAEYVSQPIYEFYSPEAHFGPTFNSFTLVMADFDLDHDQDFMGRSLLGNDIVYSKQTEPEVFVESVIGTMQSGRRMKVLDWNGDGAMDVVLGATNNSTSLQILTNTLDGFMSAVFDTPYQLSGFATGDVDGDGDDDILCFDSNDDPSVLFWMENNTTEPSATIRLIPHEPTIVIPAVGGAFTYDGGLFHTLREPRTGQIWARAHLPNGNQYVLWVQPVNLHPGQDIVVNDILQLVPGFAPAGEYQFRVLFGLHPNHPVTSDLITFSKEAATSHPVGYADGHASESRAARTERIAQATAQSWPVGNETE